MAFKRSGVRFPSPPYRLPYRLDWLSRLGKSIEIAGIAQLVEHNLAKVGVAGSSPVSRSILSLSMRFGSTTGAGTVGWGADKSSVVSAQVAQLVEHVLGKDEVAGSIPVSGSIRGQFQPVKQTNPPNLT